MPAFGLDDEVVATPAFGADDEVVSPPAFKAPASDETVFGPTEPQSLLKTLQFRTLKGFEGGLASAAGGAERLLDIGPLRPSYRLHAAQLESAVPSLQTSNEIEPPEAQQSRLEEIRRSPEFQSAARQLSAAERIRSEIMRPASSLREAAQEIGGQAGTVAQNIPGHETFGKAAEMAGGMLPLLGTAMLPGVGIPASAGLAGLQTAGDTYQRAIQAYKAAGLDDATAQKLADEAAGRAGLTSAATFSLLPGPLKASGAAIMTVLKAQSPVVKAALSLAGAATEGGTLMAADHLARSAEEMQSFNPDLSWEEALKVAGEQFLVGGLVSGALHVPGAVARASETMAPESLIAPEPIKRSEAAEAAPADVSPDAMRELEAALRGNQLKPVAEVQKAAPASTEAEPAAEKVSFRGADDDTAIESAEAAMPKAGVGSAPEPAPKAEIEPELDKEAGQAYATGHEPAPTQKQALQGTAAAAEDAEVQRRELASGTAGGEPAAGRAQFDYAAEAQRLARQLQQAATSPSTEHSLHDALISVRDFLNQSSIRYGPLNKASVSSPTIVKENSLALEQAQRWLDERTRAYRTQFSKRNVATEGLEAWDERLRLLATQIIDPRNVGASFFAGLDRYAAYGAVQAARGALKAGKAIAEAVQAAVDWLRKYHGDTGWDEGKFRGEMADYLARPFKRTEQTESQAQRFSKAQAHVDELESLRAQAKGFVDRGEPVPREIARETQRVREDLLSASEEFAAGDVERPRGRIPNDVDSALQRQPGSPAGGSGAGVPEFKGRERLPSGSLRDLFDGLNAWRKRVGNWWTRRGSRQEVTYQKDAADNRAGRAANEATNHVRLTLNRAFGDKGADVRARRQGLREAALIFVVEADGDRGRLAEFHSQIEQSDHAQSTVGRRALAAIQFADANWDKFTAAAQEYKKLTEIQREEELNDGINSNEWQGGYVYHRWKRSPEALAANPAEAAAAPTPFRKPRTVENYAEGIAGGGVPHSLNALDLLSARVADGQRALNEVNWLHGLKSMIDPASGETIAVGVRHRPRRPQGTPRTEGTAEEPGQAEFEAGRKPEWVTVPEVPGYVVQKIGPLEFAIKPEYSGLITDLTAKSWFSGNEFRQGLKSAFGAAKSAMLLFDTFHLGRLALWRASLGGVGFRKGATLLDFTRADLDEMAQRSEIPKEWVNDLIENRRRLDLALNTGFNVGQILDNAASAWIHNLPLAGPFNHWLFGQYQRGAMAEAWLVEFERTRRMFPHRSELEVARQVSRDLNARFGNLGRQGLARSRTGQDIARILFLAPQWNESLIRSELGAAKQLFRTPIDSVQQRRLVAGTLLRSTGAMVVGTFLANQILSYAFRGKPTWENPEEGWDKKISAWIPDVVGNGPGMFLNPLALPAEYTHLVSGQLSRSRDAADAAWRIVNGRLSSPVRALLMLATRKDTLGRSLKPGEVLPAMGKALIPAPIGGSGLAAGVKQVITGEPSEKFPGQFQKQILASVGVKTDQAPNPEQRMKGLAREFNQAKGIVPSAEFYAGDYAELTEALRRGNQSDARSALDDLLKKHTAAEIAKHYERWMLAPYTGQRRREAEFVRSLTPEQRTTYEQSLVARRDLARQARAMLRK